VRVGEDHSGSTAIAALVTPTHIIVANCGDSRCVLVRKSGTEEMSEDHKPYNDVEKRRIEGAGGSVTMRRVNGDLAVSRALGDFVYKHRSDLPAEAQQVSAEPEIKIVPRSPDDQVRRRRGAAGGRRHGALPCWSCVSMLLHSCEQHLLRPCHAAPAPHPALWCLTFVPPLVRLPVCPVPRCSTWCSPATASGT